MRFHDHTGERFVRLLVLRRLPSVKGRTIYLCRCDCGVEKPVNAICLVDGRMQSCGCKRNEQNRAQGRGKESRSWKGGRRREGGYILIYRPDHHRAKSNGYTREHSLVMEEKLGRLLRSGENVHHINGQKDDNRPENLELWVSSQPPGQRVADLVRWAREILATYGDEYP